MANPRAVSQSPLMQPVDYQGQPYYTSQYFHAQYLSNSQAGGKYRRHTDFLRTLRSIEAYAIYLSQGDIAEIPWAHSKSGVTQDLRYLQSLFQDAGYRPLTLLNATAQLALSHHLDDELSKQVSVATNTSVARQLTTPAALEQYQDLKAIAEMARSVMSLATSAAESRLIAQAARAEAAQANANAARAIATQLFFTVAEYVCFERLQTKIPESAYKALSDHLRLYCLDKGIPFRRIPVGGKRWDDEYGFHVSVYADALLGWLNRRYAQTDLHLIKHTGAPT